MNIEHFTIFIEVDCFFFILQIFAVVFIAQSQPASDFFHRLDCIRFPEYIPSAKIIRVLVKQLLSDLVTPNLLGRLIMYDFCYLNKGER